MTERYDFVSHLGEGGAGAVFKAFDRRLQRHVAVKRLLPASARAGTGVGTDLPAEAATLAAFQHPHVVGVYDLDFLGDEPCIVMEYLNGETLQQVLEKGPMTLPDFMQVAFQSLEAMEAAHLKGILHRDVKPSNFMLTWLPNGKFAVKVLDFGISELVHRPSNRVDDENVYGSVYYLAPEQFGRTEADHRADLYSLGCVLFSCLTGQFPFNGETLPDIRNAHLFGSLNPAMEARTDLPPALVAFVKKLIAVSPADRFQSASEAKFSFVSLQQRPMPAISGPLHARRTAPIIRNFPKNPTLAESGGKTITQQFKGVPKGRRFALIGGVAIVAAGLAVAFTPKKQDAGQHEHLDSQSAISAVLAKTGKSATQSFPPARANLYVHAQPNKGLLGDIGSSDAGMGESVDLWKDQSLVGGYNDLQYMYSAMDSAQREARLPKVSETKSQHGVYADMAALRFDSASLYLLNQSETKIPSTIQTSNQELYNGEELTCVFMLRPTSEGKGVLVGAASPDDTRTWELAYENGSFSFGPVHNTGTQARVSVPDSIDSAKYFMVIAEMDRKQGSFQLRVVGQDGAIVSGQQGSGLNELPLPSKIRLGSPGLLPRASELVEIQNGFSGDVLELMVYNRVLKPADQALLVSYLRDKHFIPME